MAFSGNKTRAQIFVNGLQLTQMTNVQVQRSTNNQEVYTAGGLGMGVGLPKVDISVNNAVPSEDIELDPEALGMFLGKKVQMVVAQAGRTGTAEGWFMSDSFEYQVNGSGGTLSFTFVAQELIWD